MAEPESKAKTRFVADPTLLLPTATKDVYIMVIVGENVGARIKIEREMVIGRGDDANIRVDEEVVSRRHARIVVEGSDVSVEDMGSTNGTFVNEERIAARSALKDGDRIQIGSTVCKMFIGAKVEMHVYDQATRDGLTGAMNKTAVFARLETEFKRWQRYANPIAVVLCDIDFFKKTNDTYGHPAGDLVLKRVVSLITGTLRDVDVVGRYGGEEFLLLLTQTAPEAARELAERVRKTIEAAEFIHDGPDAAGVKGLHRIPTTMSFGLASTEVEKFNTADEMIARADANLYASKRNGRNRVTG